MSRGGKRDGAGRKAGAVTKRTRQIADRAHTEGITPLEVMLSLMRERWASEDKDGALQAAEKAAPYVHARLQAHKHSGDEDNPIRTETTVKDERDSLKQRAAEFLAAPNAPGGAGVVPSETDTRH